MPKRKTWSNPLRGEWWIDADGNAVFADGDIGDMNHEMLVIDHLTRELLEYFNVEPDEEYAGTLDNYEDAIAKEMEWDGEDTKEMIISYLEKNARKDFDPKQLDEAIDIAYGQGDARDYALEWWDWIRVAGNNIQTHRITSETFKRMSDGIMDANGNEEMEPGELFNIEVEKTGAFYRDVPWEVIDAGDLGGLAIYR